MFVVVVDEVVPELVVADVVSDVVVAEETLVSEEALVSVEPPLASKQPCNEMAAKPTHSHFNLPYIFINLCSLMLMTNVIQHRYSCPDRFKTNQ